MFDLIALIFSLWLTPNLCSSSTTRSPNLCGMTSSDKILWVPITTSALPSFDVLKVLLHDIRGNESRQQDHLDREASEPLLKVIVMLLGKKRGRREHKSLPAVHDALEYRPECDLGLTEADVSAQESVHRDMATPYPS